MDVSSGWTAISPTALSPVISSSSPDMSSTFTDVAPETV